MKTMFAALASALLVSTAFAQTAAPAPSTNATANATTGAAASAPAGQANLKASTAAQNGALKADTTTDADTTKEKASTKDHAAKKSAAHAKKMHAHKMSKKDEGTAKSSDKEAAPANADAKADTATKAQ